MAEASFEIPLATLSLKVVYNKALLLLASALREFKFNKLTMALIFLYLFEGISLNFTGVTTWFLKIKKKKSKFSLRSALAFEIKENSFIYVSSSILYFFSSESWFDFSMLEDFSFWILRSLHLKFPLTGNEFDCCFCIYLREYWEANWLGFLRFI